jgi:YegS/Rv2252/BmrU family lipid kinase
VEVDVHFTGHPGHAIELARDAAGKEFDLVVAVGGDGTVNEVVQGLMGSQMTMGIVPWGSGNGLAYDLGILPGIKSCVRTLIQGKDTLLDVCRFIDQPFVCTAGIGFNARVAERMNNSSQRGFLMYVLLVIRESINFKAFRVKMDLNGEKLEMPVMMVTFANASQFGNHAHIAPRADMSDGMIDVVVVKPFPKILLPLVAFSLFTKKIDRFPFVNFHRVNHVTLDSAACTEYYFDGESGKLNLPSNIFTGEEKISIRS